MFDKQEYMKNYYKTHREEMTARNKEFHVTHREEVSARKKAWRADNREVRSAKQAAYRSEHRVEVAAREAVRRAIIDGRLVRLPCVTCGNPKSEAHHEDYSKPLEVTWLCRLHHKQTHLR
jgi:hypothetical protein